MYSVWEDGSAMGWFPKKRAWWTIAFDWTDGSPLAEHHTDDPAAADVRPWPRVVVEDVFVVATRVGALSVT
jgi:hypothetical protein